MYDKLGNNVLYLDFSLTNEDDWKQTFLNLLII